MMIAIIYLFPGLSSAIHTALQALMWAVALLVALSLAVAVLVAVAPFLPQLVAAAFIVGGYALLTMPRKQVR